MYSVCTDIYIYFFKLVTVGQLSGEYDLYPITTPQLLYTCFGWLKGPRRAIFLFFWTVCVMGLI